MKDALHFFFFPWAVVSRTRLISVLSAAERSTITFAATALREIQLKNTTVKMSSERNLRSIGECGSAGESALALEEA